MLRIFRVMRDEINWRDTGSADDRRRYFYAYRPRFPQKMTTANSVKFLESEFEKNSSGNLG
jgi:hypothetical protein